MGLWYLNEEKLINGKNKIEAINTWTVAILRYGAGFLERRVDEQKELDRKTRKLLIMHKGLHPKRGVMWIYFTLVEKREEKD